MAANNYFLQYHIYTVAWIKYLQLRQPDFDYVRDFGGVIYLFVRGIRANESTGVFFHKPDELAIQHFSAALVADSADASVP
jgi:exodeoxyribonuclease V beta subunit